MKLRGKHTSWLFFTLLVIALLAGGFFLWLTSHRLNNKEAILQRIPADASIAMINLEVLDRILDSPKKLFPPEGDTASLIRFIRSSGQLGLDLTVNPIWYKEAEQPGFQLVFKLMHPAKFKKWLFEGPVKSWGGKISRVGSLNTCSFDQRPVLLLFNKDFVVFVPNAEALPHAKAFFANEQITAAGKVIIPAFEFLSTADLAVLKLNPLHLKNDWLPVAPLNKLLGLRVSDTTLNLYSVNPEKEEFEKNILAFQLVSHHRPAKLVNILRNLWNLEAENDHLFDGKWSIEWFGNQSREVEFISYAFDDEFNRKEIRKVKTEFIPDLGIRFNAVNAEQLNRLENLLEKKGFASASTLKIGPFGFPTSRNENIFEIGSSSKAVDPDIFSGNFLRTNLQLNPLLRDLEQLGLSLPENLARQLKYLKFISIVQNGASAKLFIQISGASELHILMWISEHFKGMSAGENPRQ